MLCKAKSGPFLSLGRLQPLLELHIGPEGSGHWSRDNQDCNKASKQTNKKAVSRLPLNNQSLCRVILITVVSDSDPIFLCKSLYLSLMTVLQNRFYDHSQIRL